MNASSARPAQASRCAGCICRRYNAAMRLTVLGCYGGIGGLRRTTALLLDDDILIDAGSAPYHLRFPFWVYAL